MYSKSPGAGAALTILLSLFLLTACTPVPPEKIDPPQSQAQAAGQDQDPASAATAIARAFPTLTPAPAFLAGCTNVRSAGFNMGAAVGTRICLEGIIDSITLPTAADKRAAIRFVTATGKTGGALYGVTVNIPDAPAFGLDTLNQLVQGERIAVSGLFEQGASYTYVAEFLIEVNAASDLIVLG